MKFLLLNGSPRKGGNTAETLGLLGEALRERLGERGREFSAETLHISDLDIRPCRGCRACFDRGEEACPLKDDLLGIHERIRAADCAVLASPVYVNDVSGSIKTLIDRLAFVCHRPQYWSTPFYLVVTTGGTPFRHTLRTLQSAAVSWGAPLAGSSGYVTGALSSREEIKKRHGERIRKSADKLAGHLTGRKRSDPGFMALTVFSAQQASWKRELDKAGYDTADGRYWAAGGLLDRRSTYFTDHKAGKIKTALARGFGRVVSMFIT